MMTSVLAVACLFAALVAEGDSLSCMTCFSLIDASCTGVFEKCDGSSNTCITTISATTVGSLTSSIIRGCGKSSDCDKTGSLSTTLMSVKTNTGCCASDGCTPVVPPLPSSNTSLNGVICRTCLAHSSSDCYTSETMTCTGEEKKCFRAASTTTRKGVASSTMALRGCATESFCDTGSVSKTYGGITSTSDVVCTDSSIRLERVVFLPAVFFLLKALF